ncbi:SOS response-associated peptidase [Rhodococcus sp. NPDC003318]|uniref:SOS response-associated peptidase n=1 Tax=Rhodococcus sp. NPDC003318 TaxID=3364503 RepID=UPI0036BDFA23
MCGRYATTVDPALLAVELDAIDEAASAPPQPTERYNVAPTDPVLAVVARHDHDHPEGPATRRIRRMRWGLVPPWTKAGDDGAPVRSAPLFNARSDTAADKPAFRAAVKSKRALVPMDGWYEWTSEPRAGGKVAKVPHFMTPADGSTLFMAGLWSVWHAPGARPGAAPPLLSCTILTTDAVGALQSVHDRMPLILTAEHWDRWLDPDADVPADLLAAGISEEIAAGIEIRDVSDRVNSVRNDGPDLIAPAGPAGSAVGEQISLL